jgi:NAD(P)H-flavin reductase
MKEQIRQLFNEAVDMRNEIHMKYLLTGHQTEEEKLMHDFLDRIAKDYVKLTDELYVLEPFKIWIPGGYLNG